MTSIIAMILLETKELTAARRRLFPAVENVTAVKLTITRNDRLALFPETYPMRRRKYAKISSGSTRTPLTAQKVVWRVFLGLEAAFSVSVSSRNSDAGPSLASTWHVKAIWPTGASP
jgi:hypothetical protein